jgi:hypothetical protein
MEVDMAGDKRLDYDNNSIRLSMVICKIRTYFDILSEVGKNHMNMYAQNAFWPLISNALHDSIVIESFKLIDKSNKNNHSMFSLMDCVKEVSSDNVHEIESHQKTLNNLINHKDFRLQEHRHTQTAHLGTSSETLSRFADFYHINALLQVSEGFIKSYNKWIKGNENVRGFDSVFAGGHQNVLDYISKVIDL